MSSTRRHEPHPLQADFFEQLRKLRGDVSLEHVAIRFRSRDLPASRALVCALLGGETGATALEHWIICERYGLENAAEAMARMVGRTLAPGEGETAGDLRADAMRIASGMGALADRMEEALADGVVDEDEADAMLKALARIEAGCADARAKLAARRGR